MLQDHDSQRQLPSGVFSIDYLFGVDGEGVLKDLSKIGKTFSIDFHRSVIGDNEAQNVLFLIDGQVVWEPAAGSGSVITVRPGCSTVIFGFAEILGGVAIHGKVKTLTKCKFLAVSSEMLTLVLKNRADVCFTACRALGRLYTQTINLLQDL